MSPEPTLETEQLIKARDLGAATYLNAYIRLMAQALSVTDEVDTEGVNAMAGMMVEPLNIVTEMAFRKLMGDEKGVAESVLRLRRAIDTLPPPP